MPAKRSNQPAPDEPRQAAPTRLLLDGAPLTLQKLAALLDRPITVEISPPVWSRIERSVAAVQRIASGQAAAYGINTGFGKLCTTRIDAKQLERLQTNLIISHAVGVGDPVPPEIVRWMMLFKIAALCHGVSGVSPTTVDCLVKLLNADILPVIPSKGSLGASGDLAPLAHMVLPMLGVGHAAVNGKIKPAADVLKQHGIEPIRLGPKEGVALINGTQFMSAYAAHTLVRAVRLMKHADLIAAMSLDAFKGSVRPFDARLHRLRPHPGAIESAENVRRLMSDSEILASHADCDRVQDPYSFRCIPQVHGASRDAIRHAVGVVETEINSVTDNPLILDGDEVVSGGSFHGQPLALVLDYLAIAIAELASISERRTFQLLSGVDELPLLLIDDAGLNSGFMVAHYTAAALVSENKTLCTPASVDTITTSLGQEDHVSMGANAAVKCLNVLKNTETVLAIEQLCAAQALDYRSPLKTGLALRAAHAELRKSISHARADRPFGVDIEQSLEILRHNELLRAVEKAAGSLA